MRDSYNHIKPVRAISPVSVADDTAQVSQIIDMQGFQSLLFVIAAGSLADADATFTVLVEDGDESDLSDGAAVADINLLGTESDASFTFADDDTVQKIGYRGYKRYVRLTITPASNASAGLLSAVALLSHAEHTPV